MQAGRRYSLLQLIKWEKEPLIIFLVFDSFPVILYQFFGWEWLHIPWQPISLIGIAVAFYLGFKNNSSYERLWEARKIWGGIVNASRSFAVMSRDFVFAKATPEVAETDTSQRLIYRHIAWLYALSFELRKLKKWEHNGKAEQALRKALDSEYSESKFEKLKKYISPEEYEYVMSKGNRSSHLLSLQSKDLISLRKKGKLDRFRHLEMQALITEFYALQGKSERIKNFPFPRQYATVNYYFVLLFVILLPFGMLDVFAGLGSSHSIWFSVVFSVLGSWVFWTMEMIGDYSENPFEGTYNDVPISSMVVGIEIDIRQMLEETDLPEPIKPVGEMDILL